MRRSPALIALALAFGLGRCAGDCGGMTTADTGAADTGWRFDATGGDASSPERSVDDGASARDVAATDSASPDRATNPDRAAPGDGATGLDRGDAATADRAVDPTDAGRLDHPLPVDATAADALTSDAGLPASGTIEHWLQAPDDAVSAYLMDPGEGAWNQFGGATAYLGRHWDLDHVSYHTGLRFAGVQVPRGAIIDDARLWISPANDVDRSRNLWINIYAEASGDAAPFDLLNHVSGRPDQRARTTAHVDHWLLRCNDSCTELTEYDCPQRQLDCWARDLRYACPKQLAPLVQEVVDHPDWQPGNALALLLINAATDEDGADYQSHRAFSGVDSARPADTRPLLVLRYHLP